MQTKFTLKTVLIISLIAYSFPLTATIRYVSHTGSSTPPYTTWATAADSIQKCINYSVDGDTIIVANGVYYESLIVNKYLWLIGSSMDSTVIDGTGLADITIDFQSDGYIKCFIIKGKGEGTSNSVCIGAILTNSFIKFCKIINADRGIGLTWSSSVVDQCIINNVRYGYSTYCAIDTCNPVLKNSIISILSDTYAVNIGTGSIATLNNNIIGNFNSSRGIGIVFDASNNRILNNIVLGFIRNIDGYATDTAIVHNNISSYGSERGFTINTKTDMRNNIVINNETGVVGPSNTNSDYNLYWQNNTHTTGGFAVNDIIADPMFVNDTTPTFGGTYDYHLQAYSPAIDRGDPNILDVDGSRSDIGAYGGPGGETYTYIDLPPRAPVNLNAVVENGYVSLSWNRNTEADTAYYNVYRDTIMNFTIDSTKLVGSPTDTFYTELLPEAIINLYYKVTAVDNQGNESLPSEEEVVVVTTGKDDWKVVDEYFLYQNYPNPFNPSTNIGYKLKERGYIKLMVYDIKGELILVLVNQVQEAGYHEVNFDAEYSMPDTDHKTNGLASGIYLYRIEVIGEGNIPRFSGMKKMILVK
jgi:hypothetical protein